MTDVCSIGAVAFVAACTVGCGPTKDDAATAASGTPAVDSEV